MNIRSHTELKAIYRVTGTPENFLTAVRYNVWGFNKENEKHWKKLMPGNIIFFHSKGSDSKFVSRPQSGVLGFGIVGNNFFIDSTPLWIDEKFDGKVYPYRFAFSELYLFATIPINDDWDSTTFEKTDTTRQMVQKLVESAIPLGELDGFPHMGSYSAIQNSEVKKDLLGSARKLNFYDGEHLDDLITKSTDLRKIENEAEILRYSTTLTVFEDIKEKIVSEHKTQYSLDTKKLAQAEKAHFNVVSYFLSFFQDRGYNVLFNNHVDLFAFNNKTSVLVEAKSLESKNFIPQSRKGIVQLFEYNHFDISRFKKEHNLNFSKEISLLATSERPSNDEYVGFINSLNIKTVAVKNASIVQYGESINVNDF